VDGVEGTDQAIVGERRGIAVGAPRRRRPDILDRSHHPPIIEHLYDTFPGGLPR
jgi:hypothetical protein